MTSSYAILWALSAGFFFALGDFSLKMALQYSSPTVAINVMVWVQWVIFTVICWVSGTFSNFSNPAFPWFLVTGFMNPVLFLFLYTLGIQRIGLVRSAPLKGFTPVVAVVFAFVVLEERLIAFQYVGIAMTIGGIFAITTEDIRRESPIRDPAAPSPGGGGAADGPSEKNPTEKTPAYRRLGYLFTILAATSTGLSSVLFKIVLLRLPSPLFGAWLGACLGVVLYPFVAFLFPPGERFGLRRSAWPWLICGGASMATAIYSLFAAIHLGLVSIVTTLYQISPLIVLVLAVLFLRKLERVTPRVVAGGLMTVGGGILVSVF